MNSESKQFFVLEGTDLSGKTTIAKLLAHSQNAELLKSPPVPFESIKQYVLENGAPLARFCYFLASNLQISSMAREILTKKSVVCDRYLWSTIAYHSAIESISPQKIVRIVEPLLPAFLIPSCLIYLKVDRQTQLSRANGRADDRLQRGLLLSENFQQRLTMAYEEIKNVLNAPRIEVDTSELTVSESLKRILDKIES